MADIPGRMGALDVMKMEQSWIHLMIFLKMQNVHLKL